MRRFLYILKFELLKSTPLHKRIRNVYLIASCCDSLAHPDCIPYNKGKQKKKNQNRLTKHIMDLLFFHIQSKTPKNLVILAV